tara:strand:- start:564 stop:803 length:240 start_codon:yes stop_codon:yes gene_type:complete
MENSTLKYKSSYDRRVKLYESRQIEPVKKSKGLGDRLEDKKTEQKVSLDDMLQEEFNMIRENNKMLIESANMGDSRDAV